MSISSRLIERCDPERAFGPLNITGAATAGAWNRMVGHRMLIVLQTGAWAGGSSAITLEQATAAAGTGNKALGMTRVWKKTNGLFSEVAVASNTFDVDTANALYVIEVQSDELDVNGNYAYVQVKSASPGANADYLSAYYHHGDLRYGSLLEDREDAKV